MKIPGDNTIKTVLSKLNDASLQYYYLTLYRADDVIISLFEYHTLHYDIAPRQSLRFGNDYDYIIRTQDGKQSEEHGEKTTIPAL